MPGINDIKQQWRAATEKQTANPKERRGHFERILTNPYNKNLADWYKIFAEKYQRNFAKDSYAEILEEDYYTRFPADRPPEEDAHTAYEMGKFHQIITNSLHTLEAFAQGFIGCLIGGLFIGTGMMLGTLIREALDLQTRNNEKSLDADDIKNMSLYLYYKITQVFDMPSQGESVRNILNLEASVIKLDFGDQLKFIKHYEAAYDWTNVFQERMRAHMSESGDTLESAQTFALSSALAVEMLENREAFCSPENINHGAQRLQVFVRTTINDVGDPELKASLLALFALDESDAAILEKNMPILNNVDLTIPVPTVKNRCGDRWQQLKLKQAHFTPMYNQFVAICEYQDSKLNPFKAMGKVCQTAAYKGGYTMMKVYYDYLMAPQQQQQRQNANSRSRLLNILNAKPSPMPAHLMRR